MQYPGRVIKMGETDARIVKALKTALNKALALTGANAIKLDPENPNFGPNMKQAVQLFQARNVDSGGRALKTDGEVGSVTWEILFGADSVPQASGSSDTLLAEVLAVAAAEEARQVREVPPNSNRGPDVEGYLASVGLKGGNPWCCAFTYWCFQKAAEKLGVPNPMVKTGGCLDHWARSAATGARRVLARDAATDPSLLVPGMVFIMDFGGGKGHTGFITSVGGGFIETIEGNTDASKTREGGGVYRLTRKLVDMKKDKGFIDYSGV